jgi:hypothetical protein
MLEILFLIHLCKELGKIVRNKGRSATGYQWMLVLFWIVGEIIGMVAGVIAVGAGIGAYLCALLGAAAGAVAAFIVVKNLAPTGAVRRRNIPVAGYSDEI